MIYFRRPTMSFWLFGIFVFHSLIIAGFCGYIAALVMFG